MKTKEDLLKRIKIIADEMDSLEWELQDYQDQIDSLYEELDNLHENDNE